MLKLDIVKSVPRQEIHHPTDYPKGGVVFTEVFNGLQGTSHF